MSHFAVTVRVTAKRLAANEGKLNLALAEMLTPFGESPETGSPFLIFESHEEEVRRGWANEDVGVREVYTSIEQYAEHYYGYKQRSGRFGRWINPNAKWDWWVVGGRWSGYYPLLSGAPPRLGQTSAFDDKPTPGHGDIVRPSEINMLEVASATIRRAEAFWSEWTAWLGGKKFDAFGGPRHEAMKLGLVHIANHRVESTKTTVVKPWIEFVPSSDMRSDWTDVYKIITRETLMRDLIEHFNPIVSSAALDNDGWHAPNAAEQRGDFCKAFMSRFIGSAASDDTLVVVDCHI
jgi:hypothetical protein